MDPTVVAQQSGLDAWLQQYGNAVLFFGQSLYFLSSAVIAVAAIWAAIMLSRYLKAKTGDAAPAAAKTDEEVKVDEFID